MKLSGKILLIDFFITFVILIFGSSFFNVNLNEVSDFKFILMVVILGPLGFVIVTKIYFFAVGGYILCISPLLLVNKFHSKLGSVVFLIVVSAALWLLVGYFSFSFID